MAGNTDIESAWQSVGKRHAGIALILLAYLGLGMLYSVAVPLFEAPDEDGHYSYVNYMAAGRGLPAIPIEAAPDSDSSAAQPAPPGTPTVSPYVVTHPPLYYALSALATSWIDMPPLNEAIWYNPHFDYGVHGLRGNKNAVIHTQEEAFPYTGISLAVHVSRWVSLLLGSGAVVGTYLLARELFPHRRVLAHIAAALTAFNPQFIFIAARVGNDAAVAAFCCLTLWATVQFMRREHPGWQPLWMGVFLGLGMLSKVSATGMVPVVGLAILAQSIRNRSMRSFLLWGAVTFGAATVVGGWWYVRNGLAYGDPLLWNVHLELVPRRHPTPSLGQLYQREFGGLEMSYWAVFGWMNITAHSWIYTILRLLTRLSALGLLLLVVRLALGWATATSASSRLQPEPDQRVYGLGLGLVAIWLIILFTSLLQFMRVQPGAQGRYLFPAISAISVLLVLGLDQWLPGHWPARRSKGILPGGAAAGLFALSLASPFLYIVPAYTHPAVLSPEQIPSESDQVHVDFGGQMELVAAQVDGRLLRPGDKAEITLCWEALARMDRDYTVSAQLFGQKDKRVGQLDIYPGVGGYPTTLWEVGDIICDAYQVPISRQAEGPVAARVNVALYDRNTMERLPAWDNTRQPVGRVTVGRIKILPQQWPSYEIGTPTHFTLGNELNLIGYNLSPQPAEPGEQLQVVLYWQVVSDLDQDYTVFVHLLDDAGHTLAQADAQPMQGDYPTSYWDHGEQIRDEYSLVVPAGADPGQYRIAAGMYLLATGQRLPVRDADGLRVPDDRIMLGPIELASP